MTVGTNGNTKIAAPISAMIVGIVSLGDISVETAPSSLLADISTASPDR